MPEWTSSSPFGMLQDLVDEAIARLSFAALVVASAAFLWVVLPRVEQEGQERGA